jgi:hypothetical protein
MRVTINGVQIWIDGNEAQSDRAIEEAVSQVRSGIAFAERWLSLVEDRERGGYTQALTLREQEAYDVIRDYERKHGKVPDDVRRTFIDLVRRMIQRPPQK